MNPADILRRSLVLLAVCWPIVAAGQDDHEHPAWGDTLGGDWGGLRAKLYQQGVDLQFVHKSDVMANLSGGIKRETAWLGHTEANLALDMERLLGWNATTAYVHYLSDLGAKFNRDAIGAFVGVDNIEVATNTAQFSHAWLQKSFFGGDLSLLAGLYAIDSEFYVTDTSAVFLQPPYGMANELAQTGQNGPPIFPLGALALRVKYTSPGKNFYMQGALTDGVPGDPGHPHGTHIKLGHGDGTLSIVEFGYTPQEDIANRLQKRLEPADLAPEEREFFNKTAIGFWQYSARFDDLTAVDAAGKPVQRHSQGAYFLAERTLPIDHRSKGIAGFMRFGVASEDIHQSDWSASLGLRFHGLIPKRDDDIAGIALTVNHASDKYRRLNNADSREVDLEATYQARVRSWLSLQPNVQYIINPGMDPTLKNTTIIGFRTEVLF